MFVIGAVRRDNLIGDKLSPMTATVSKSHETLPITRLFELTALHGLTPPLPHTHTRFRGDAEIFCSETTHGCLCREPLHGPFVTLPTLRSFRVQTCERASAQRGGVVTGEAAGSFQEKNLADVHVLFSRSSS